MSLSPNEKNQIYFQAIQNALFAFQMIEEALKIYISGSYEIIKRSTPHPAVFNFNTSSINEAPLGKLINMFSSVSANTNLVKDIRKIQDWRNFCAHRAYVHEFMSRQSGAPVSDEDVENVKTITTFAFELLKQIGSDMIILREAHRTVFGGESKNA